MKITLVLTLAAALSLVSLVLGLSFEYHSFACYAVFAIAMAFSIFIRDYTRVRAYAPRAGAPENLIHQWSLRRDFVFAR